MAVARAIRYRFLPSCRCLRVHIGSKRGRDATRRPCCQVYGITKFLVSPPPYVGSNKGSAKRQFVKKLKWLTPRLIVKGSRHRFSPPLSDSHNDTAVLIAL